MSDIQAKVISWFGAGDTGLSSKSIAIAGTGGDKPACGWNYPHDPADFGRCARLLQKVPQLATPAFDRLKAEGGPKWQSLIERWDEIHQTMESEVGIDWSKGRRATKTYELMKSIGL